MSGENTLSVTIIGHNESGHLEQLLPGLDWADEVIYVDCESEDDSLQTARNFGCRVFSRPNNPNLNVNKSFAMQQAKSDWIFYLDPDERIPVELSREIRRTINNSGSNRAFMVPRRNHYFGRWLRFGSQFPDLQLRLFRKGFAEFPLQHVHEKLLVNGSTGRLENHFLHYPYLNISQYLQKFDFYTEFEANYLYRQGTRPGWGSGFRFLIWLPFTRFLRRYLLKQGFRDGWPGLFAALFDALNFAMRYFKFLEIHAIESRKQSAKTE